MSESNRLLRQQEAAELLSISRRHLSALVRHHGLPCVRLGKAVRFAPDDLVAFIEKQRTNSSTATQVTDGATAIPISVQVGKDK